MLPLILTVICLVGLTSQQTVNDCPAGVPRDEYLKVHGGNCFQFVLDLPADYVTAEQDCGTHGGTLPLVKNQNTTDFLIDQLVYEYGGVSKIWIGLSDRAKEGTFVWADGTPLGEYTNWVSHTGNTSQLHDCVTFDASKNGQWQEDYCSDGFLGLFLHENSYVCQYKPRSSGGR